MNKLYKFYWDCGRNGSLDGCFIATDEEIAFGLGKDLYFGEVLGKHSEIYGPLEEGDLEMVSDDQELINKLILLDILPVGFNPLNYISEKYYEEEEYFEEDELS